MVEAVLERAQQRFEGRLQALAGEGAGPVARLTAFAALFADAQGAGDRLCPFCTVTTAQDSVPQSLRARLRRFWLAAETWLTDVLEEGHGRGLFTVPGGAAATAATLVAAFEGAMIAACATGENDRLCLVVQWLRDVLCGSAAGAVVPQRAVSAPDR
ncbi:MAG: hypothetical protein IT495_11485 [Gammaproteobacteria bacterium]|nr:hypothetical protein [Gammaproteobacteria bacterium]